MINYLIFLTVLFFFVLLIDIYFHVRHKSILEHLVVTNNYYEKILLLKQVISLDDVAYTREKIRRNLGDKKYKKVQNLFLHYDDDYLNYLKDLGSIKDAEKNIDFDKVKKNLGDMIYYKDYTKAAQHIADLHKEKVLENKKRRK